MRCLALPVRVALVLMVLTVNALAQPIEYLSTGGDNPMLAPLPFATLAVEPASAPDGSIYYNSAMGPPTFRCRVAGAWQSCALASGGGGVLDVGSTDVLSSSNCAVLYTDGTKLGAETAFCWDETNNRLGVNQSSPLYNLDVNGTTRTNAQVLLTGDPTSTARSAATLSLDSPTAGATETAINTALNGSQRCSIDYSGNILCLNDATSVSNGGAVTWRLGGGTTFPGIQLSSPAGTWNNSNGVFINAVSGSFATRLTMSASQILMNYGALTTQITNTNNGTGNVFFGSPGGNSHFNIYGVATHIIGQGTAAAPSLGWQQYPNDSNTGFYQPASDQVGISTGGVSRMVWANSTTSVSNTFVFQSATNNTNCTLNPGTGTCTATTHVSCVNPQCTPRTFLVGAAQIACALSGTTVTATSSIGDSRVVNIFCP